MKRVDSLAVDNFKVNNFEIEIGAMEYGVDIDGIIGMDFLLRAKATIDFEHLRIIVKN